jgi:hypothetical protein
LDSTGSGQGPLAGCCECGDEPSGSCTMELVFHIVLINGFIFTYTEFLLFTVNIVKELPCRLHCRILVAICS